MTLSWVAEPLSLPGAGEILVETLAGAVSLGSELPLIRGDARSSAPPSFPRMTGYESVAVVRSVGDAVVDLSPGDRVAASYGHRTAAILPANRAIPIPAAANDAIALLTILTCDVAKGIGRAKLQAHETILIGGAGAIGLLTIWSLHARRLGPVDVIEPQPARRELALRLGARRAVHPSDSDDLDVAYDAAIECSSRNASFHQLQAAVRLNGRIVVLSDGNLEQLTLAPVFHERELTIVGSSDGLDYPTHARWFFGLSPGLRSPLAELFEVTIAVADLERTLLQLAAGGPWPIKILVRY